MRCVLHELLAFLDNALHALTFFIFAIYVRQLVEDLIQTPHLAPSLLQVLTKCVAQASHRSRLLSGYQQQIADWN
jgi:hypothetical protein